MTIWDNRFNTEQFIYGTEPNVFFAEHLKTLKTPGKLLLPGEGEGRNAVFAARLGWEVDAFDSSSVARKKALDFAAKENVTIKYDLLDINDFTPAQGKYDLIVLIFIHLPEEVRIPFFKKLVTSLKTGGSLMVVAFAKEQIHYSSGGPPDVNKLTSCEELKQDFARLTIQKLCHEKIFLDEGHHHGMAEVVRLIAVKE